tara:strand:+ start:7 stop:1398 length:1392 start_codon:yes stop_codon:yes gene_type:complete
MLFSNSPVKNIVEKLNPFSQKNKISRLKFERKGDYKTFLKFIKDSTKEIEDIKIPDSEDKKRKGLMIGGGILGLALLTSLGRGDDDDSGVPRKIGEVKNLNDVLRKVKADKQRITPSDRNKKSISDVSRIAKISRKAAPLTEDAIEVAKAYRRIKKRQIALRNVKNKEKNRTVNKKYPKDQQIVDQNNARRNQSVTTEVGDDTTKIKKSNTATIDNNQGKQGPTGGTRGRSGGNKPDLSEFERMVKRADDIDKRIKQKLNDPNFRVPDKIKKEIDRINKQLSRKDLNSQTRKRLTDRLSNINKNIKEIQTQNKKLNPSKLFQAPEIPSNKTKKLNNFDKFNKFSNRVLNSPVGKFTTFMGGLLASPKVEIIKQLFTATPLADGTLEGKPGVFNPAEQLIFNEDAAVNIFNFSEGRESMIPFSADVQLPSVTTPTEIQTGSNKIVVDYEFNTTEDLFFIKMAGS